MRLATFQGNTRRMLFVRIVLLLVVTFVVFEIGVRLLPADAVQYNIQIASLGGPIITRSGTITDPATIARWRAIVTAKPTGDLLVGTLIGQWRRQYTCSSAVTYFNVSYVFLWHGLPIEAVSSLPICTQPYTISSGGVFDPRTYYVDLLVQP